MGRRRAALPASAILTQWGAARRVWRECGGGSVESNDKQRCDLIDFCFCILFASIVALCFMSFVCPFLSFLPFDALLIHLFSKFLLLFNCFPAWTAEQQAAAG